MVLPESRKVLGRKEVNIINTDARFFVKKTNRKYDCAILAAGSPLSIRVNRFYTVEFFESVKKVLGKGGIFSFGLPSSENYINEELNAMLSSVYFSLKRVFDEVFVIPGFTAYFISCREGKLTKNWRILEKRANEKNLSLLYVRDYFIALRLAKEKTEWMKEVLNRGGRILNYDRRPLSCYFNLLFWTSRFWRKGLSKLLLRLKAFHIWFFFVGFAFLTLIYLEYRGFSREKAVLFSVFATGFSSMAVQITVLFAFQIVYGFLFYRIGLLLTLFMLGLSMGSFFSSRKLKPEHGFAGFVLFQKLIFFIPVSAVFLFYTVSVYGNVFASFALFYFLPAIAGFLCGWQFPLANAIVLKDKVGRTCGLVYGFDLLGSCLGAFLSGVFLIPILGIYGFCLFTAVLDGIALILLFSYNRLKGEIL
jgi:spermidine synthase